MLFYELFEFEGKSCVSFEYFEGPDIYEHKKKLELYKYKEDFTKDLVR